MHLPLSDMSASQAYAMLTQTVIPRPVAWVLSENAEGNYNLAPFSYFNAVASEPPLIMLSIGCKPSGEEKDTRVNIRERKECVVHLAHEELAWSMTQTAATLPSGESELDALDLTLTDMPGSRLPRIAACRLAFACRHHDTVHIGKQHIIFAEVTDIHVDDAAVGEDAKGRLRIVAENIAPVGRLGGAEYVTFGEVLNIPRPA